MRSIVVALMLAGTVMFGPRAQGPVPREPMIQKTTVGAELFKFYCANCHGLDATGRPATSSMGTPSSDLTRLSVNNGGVFPRDQVRDVIVHGAGRGQVHGQQDMPVWGTIFRALEPSDTMVEIRIDSLVRYIESLQNAKVGTGDAQ